MKHLILSTFIVACYGSIGAQTLTDANSIPAIGYTETRTYYTYNSSDPITWATSGSDNLWDATSLVPAGPLAVVTYRAPGDSPYAGSYPATTLCAERAQGDPESEWRHYIVDAAHVEMIGVSGDAVVGGQTYCTYPFSSGNSFSDTWTINGMDYNNTYTYVASGSVQAPWGIIPDVVMFRTFGGVFYDLFQASNVLDPIGTYGFGIDLWKVDVSTGIGPEARTELGMWPNPASGSVRVTWSSTAMFQCTVFDASGRVVLQQGANKGVLLLDLGQCAPGCYMVRLTDVLGRRSTGRLVVN